MLDSTQMYLFFRNIEVEKIIVNWKNYIKLATFQFEVYFINLMASSLINDLKIKISVT